MYALLWILTAVSSVDALAQSAATRFSVQQLNATVYSETAAELFWFPRDESIVSEYEILRNGESLGIIGNASSYFDDTLTAGSSYTYSVIAITRRGERSDAATIDVQSYPGAVEGGISMVDASADDDAIPSGLRASVYSGSALELFWDREPGIELYEIERNGELVDVVSGNSYFTDRLESGTEYSYTVYAVDSDSPASALGASIDVNTAATASGINSTNAALLQNARIIIYSDTAAELFWDRPAESLGIAYVEILRDEAFLTRTNNGTSWFDDTRLVGSQHSYTLIARNTTGTELERIRVEETPDGINTEEDEFPQFISPILAEWNLIDVVQEVFTVLSGQAFGNELLSLPDYNNALYLSPAQILGATVDTEAAADTCINGGTATINPLLSTDSSTANGWDFAFDNCLNDVELIDGELTRILGSEFVVESAGLMLDGQDRDISFSGMMRRQWAAPLGTTDTARHLIVSDLNWRRTQFDGALDISDANFSYTNNEDNGVSISGSFNLASSLVQTGR